MNLVTGDLSFSSTTHSLTTLGGSAGLSLSYNSLESTENGLEGQYFRTVNGEHDFSATDTLVTRRLDPQVNGQWTSSSPATGGLTGQPFLVKWTGVVTVPSAGHWEFGVVSTGGMRVYEGTGATLVTNDWSGGDSPSAPTYGTTVTLGAGAHAITVEAWSSSPEATDELWMKHEVSSTTQPEYLVPSSWLAPNPLTLPTGWTLSAANLGGGWTKLDDLGSEVVLQQVTGDTVAFTKGGHGHYVPAPGYSDLFLSVDGTGQFQLSTPTMELYTFNPDGTVTSVTTVATAEHPAALQYTYAGSDLALTKITDPVSQRSVDLYYGGGGNCPRSSDAPTGMLCEISYSDWDGTETTFTYDANGQLVQFTNPGTVTADFAYTATGRVDAIRDPLANDAISAGKESDCPATGTTKDCETQVAYTTTGKVSAVTQPEPTPGAARPERTYRYTATARKATVTIAGFSGTGESVTYDTKGRITTETTAAGLTTKTFWNDVTEPVATITGKGEETASAYDIEGQVTDSYGPAPEACFTATSHLPVATPVGTSGCGVSVPHTHTGYDQGMTGLAATYWANSTLAGAPYQRGTIPSAVQSWAASPVGTDAWSAQFTGTVHLNAGIWDAYIQTPPTGASTTVFVNNMMAVTDIGTSGGLRFANGVFTVPTTGTYPLEIDYVNPPTSSSGGIYVFLTHGGSTTTPRFTVVGGQHPTTLNPGYGLKTSTTTPTGDVTDYSYTDPADGIDPQYGLVTATTDDPGGTDLITTTDYEDPNVATAVVPVVQAAIGVGTAPTAIAVTPNGQTAYVANGLSQKVTPVTLVHGTAGTAITVADPTAIAITPSGTTAYVTDQGSGMVTPVTLADGTAGTAIAVGEDPDAIAITPSGATAYVANKQSGSVTPVTLADGTAGTAIAVGEDPDAIAITPSGATAYVANQNSTSVTPITLAHGTAGTAIAVGTLPDAIAIAPNGATAYVANETSDTVMPITLAHGTTGTAIAVGFTPSAIAITPNGATAYVADENPGSNSVTPITLAHETAGTAIAVGTGPDAIAITPNGTTAYVVNEDSNSVTPITIGTTGYLQKTATVLPDGGTTSDEYYTGTGGPVAAACGVSTTTPQGGQLAQQTGPTPGTSGKARVEQFVYNAAGEQVGVRVGDASDIASASWQCTSYDAQGRMTSETWPAFGTSPARMVTFTYSVATNPLESSVETGTTVTTKITTTVDLEGRVVDYTSAGKTTATTYDQAGQVTETTGPGGTADDHYNTDGQLKSVSLGTTTLATATYCSASAGSCAGELESVAYDGGVTAHDAYDTDGQESEVAYEHTSTGSLFAGDEATYSLGGREFTDSTVLSGQTTFTNPNPTGGADFTYDGAGRLAGAEIPSETIDYSYATSAADFSCATPTAGKNTDLTSVTTYPSTGGTATTAYCYNGADQLTKTVTSGTATTAGSGATTTFAFDAEGYQTDNKGATYTWTANGLLATATTGGTKATYTYDAVDRLIQRTRGSTTTRYAYCGFTTTPCAVLNGSGTVEDQLVATPGGALYTVAPGSSDGTFSFPDLAGNFITAKSVTGTASSPVAYTPFGTPTTSATAPKGGLTSGLREDAFGADGKLTDATLTTPIVFMGARAYSPAEGRFLSVDPVEGGCANAYVYVRGDPLASADLTGRNSCTYFVDNTGFGVVSGSIVGDSFEFSWVSTVGKNYPGLGCPTNKPAQLCAGYDYTTSDNVVVSVNGKRAETISGPPTPMNGDKQVGISGSLPVSHESTGSGPPLEITLTFTLGIEESTGPANVQFQVKCSG